MQRPSTQVSRSAQRTPAQGSRSGTQRARQRSAPQVFSTEAHGSGAQNSPMHTWPIGQKALLP